LFLSCACEGTPAYVGHAAANRINLLLTVHIEGIAPELKMGPAATGAAEASQVRELIATLLDDSAAAKGLQLALSADCMQRIDMCESFPMEEPGVYASILRYTVRPELCATEVSILNSMTAANAVVVNARDWPAAERQFHQVPPPTGLLSDPSSISLISDGAQSHFRTLTDRRLAATALAIRLFVIDHGGAWPTNLEQLVPEYLPAVPLDAMAAGQRPIRYLSRSVDPVIYSVGSDGVDDGGSEQAMPGQYDDLGPMQRVDRVFYLTVRPRQWLRVERPNDGGGLVFVPGYDSRTPWERGDPLTTDWHAPTTTPAVAADVDAGASPMPMRR